MWKGLRAFGSRSLRVQELALIQTMVVLVRVSLAILLVVPQVPTLPPLAEDDHHSLPLNSQSSPQWAKEDLYRQDRLAQTAP